jgi:glycosyltransferase involved in cell wall biosynthesis
MRILLIHQNFPGQFRQLCGVLIERGHDVVAVGRRQGFTQEGLTYGLYAIDDLPPDWPGCDRFLELALRRAFQVRKASQLLRAKGWIPDAVLFHSSWGEGLYLRDVWPEQRLVAYPELYASPSVMGFGYDESLGPVGGDLLISMRHLNLLALAAIADSDALICPTHYQRDSFPPHLSQNFHVIHEGVDVKAVAPYPNRCLVLGPELALRSGDPVVTYCSRHLEPLRGFPTFMRAVALLQQRHASVQVVIVGENSEGYGPASLHSGGHCGALLEELAGQLDLERIHFVGRVNYDQLIGLFQVSAAHVYLTYPYTLSWSLLEAMACAAPLVGSRGLPVQEVIHHGENGLLVDFNSPEQLSQALLQLLEDRALAARLAAAGRATVEQHYELHACADAYEAVLRG